MIGLILTAMLGGICLASSTSEDLGTLEGRWPARDTDEIRVEFPVGEMIFESSDGSDIVAELEVRCRSGSRSCYERSKRLRLVTNVAGRTRHLRLDGMNKLGNRGLEVTLRIAVPKTLAVNAEMGVGSLRVEGIVRDLRVELGVGEVTMLLDESAVRSVNLTVGVGDATLRHGGQAKTVSGLLGRKVRWHDGPGAADVRVELGVGDIDVRLN